MKQTFIKSAMLLLLILSMATTRAQEVALKTNLLGWASTSANVGIEIGTGKKTTFQLFGTLNPRSEERRVGKECRSRWSPYH